MASKYPPDDSAFGKRRLIESYKLKHGIRSMSSEAVIDVDDVSDISEPVYEEVQVRRADLLKTAAKPAPNSSGAPHTGSDEGYADSQTLAYDNDGFVKDPEEFGVPGEDEASKPGFYPEDFLHHQVELELPDLPEDELAVLKKYLAEPRVSVVKPWDVFRMMNTDNEENTESKCMLVCYKITKVVVSGLLFLLVLAGAICAKGTLLFIASHVRTDIDFVCNINNDTSVNYCFREPIDNKAAENASSTLSTTLSSAWNNLPDFPDIAWNDWVTSQGSVAEFQTGLFEETDQTMFVPGVNGTVFVQVHLCEEITMRWAWALLLCMATPCLLGWLRNIWRICFKRTKSPLASTLGFVMLIETIHEIGLTMFAFVVLPKLSVVRAMVVMLGVSVVPGLLRIFNRPQGEKKRPFLVAFDIIAAVAQISLIVIWPLSINFAGNREKIHDMWPITVSLLLVSLGWWENFIDKNTNLGAFGGFLLKMKKRIASARSKIYVVVFMYKVALKLAFMVLWLWLLQDYHPDQLFNFNKGGAYCTDIHEGGFEIGLDDYDDTHWVFTWLVQVLCAFVCFLLARVACQIKLQIVGFSIPLLLSTLVTFGLLIGACEAWNDNPFAFAQFLPGYLFFNCYPKGELEDVAVTDNIWVIPVWWVSELVITRHIWFPQAERMAKTTKLFLKSLYTASIFEQSLTLNRRLDDTEFKKDTKAKDYGLDGDEFQVDYYNLSQNGDTTSDPFQKRQGDSPMIYIAATMWHENENEMCQLLKSIFRLDIDQSARRNAQQFLEIVDPDYYEFEAHVFFDDAFDAHGFDDMNYSANDFVKMLVRLMDGSASAVHKVNMKIPSPTKYDTPYGGRLEWRLPGGNKLTAHLKDKVKIRHKKRWSQCMYMYYFLGHRLWAQTDDAKRKQQIADNTFVLALDGDVDFQPKAVQLLVDLMKKNSKVGAACGRIHPIGSGPMVWYQMFEYAIGHWFQKATEHMIGCVLCSPGCFSLFRGSALMDDNVMKKYTTISTEPSHYVQYDQGEDRWLCTLMLQQGWRVEYCAASDSWTFAPEGFNEFYNQRRRWTPSTMANIIDLLRNWKHTIKMNENISMLYIIYQGALMMSTILGPGTIFLMIIGALQTAFGQYGLNMWGAFAINIVPVSLYVLICFVCKTDTQLLVAGILSAVYALIQMLVIVGLALSIVDEGFCSPSALFLFAVIAFFIVAAIVHPQEFFCIVPGALYFLLIPSMYLFLIIYSMCNMHVVSWGTREVKSASIPKPQEQQEQPKEEPQKNKLLEMLNTEALQNTEEGFDCAMGSCFKCVCCPRPTENKEGKQYIALVNKIDELQTYIKEDRKEEVVVRERKISEASLHRSLQGLLPEIPEGSREETATPSEGSEKEINFDNEVDDALNDKDEEPAWLTDPDLEAGPICSLDDQELEFWKGMILQYLFPLENNKEHQKQIAEGLLELRNKMTFAFFIFNALFVVVIFVLQLQKESGDLIVRWPCFEEGRDWIEVEPIGFVFLVFFGIIMLIQFLGMIAHRLGTLWHIIATTFVGCTKKSHSSLIQENVEGAIELAKRLQRLKGVDDDDRRSSIATSVAGGSDEMENEYVTVRRRKNIAKLGKNKSKLQRTKTLNDAFAHRFVALGNQIEAQNPDTVQDRMFKDVKGPSRGKSIRAFNKLQENANYIFNEQKMEMINKRMSKRQGMKKTPDTVSLTPAEQPEREGRIRFSSVANIIDEGGEERFARRRTQSASVARRKISVQSIDEDGGITMKDIKPGADSVEGDVPPPTGPRINQMMASSTSASSLSRADWTGSRERTESNISTIKTLIEMADKANLPPQDKDPNVTSQRL